MVKMVVVVLPGSFCAYPGLDVGAAMLCLPTRGRGPSLSTHLSRPCLAFLLFSLCSDFRYLTSGGLNKHPSNSTAFFAGQGRAQSVNIQFISGCRNTPTRQHHPRFRRGKPRLRGIISHKGPLPGKCTLSPSCSSSEGHGVIPGHSHRPSHPSFLLCFLENYSVSPYFILSFNIKCCCNLKLSATGQSVLSYAMIVLHIPYFFLCWGYFKHITFKKATTHVF